MRFVLFALPRTGIRALLWMMRKAWRMTEVLLITALVVAAFYLFFIRPTRSEERRRQRDLTDLRVGDTVLTRGGLIAEVAGG